MESLEHEILEANKKGILFSFIYENIKAHSDQQDALVNELARLHNMGGIDLVASFRNLKNDPNKGHIFFTVRDIFEKALPKIDAPIAAVMDCVINLVREAGQDRAAGWILHPFTDFLKKDRLRPAQALDVFNDNIEQYADLLPQIMMAGASYDAESYLLKNVKLAENKNLVAKRAATYSLGFIDFPTDKTELLDLAVSCIQTSIEQETDDKLLASAIHSSFYLLKKSSLAEEQIQVLVDKALGKGQDQSLHIAAQMLGRENQNIDQAFIDILLFHLLRVKPEYKITLRSIDYGLVRLLQEGKPEKVIDFMEKLLRENAEKLSIKEFVSTIHEIANNQREILSLLIIRWFDTGNRALCEAVSQIVEMSNVENMILEIDPNELNAADHSTYIFVARKAIGYLFSWPVTAASIIVSLMVHAPEDQIIEELMNLLLEPLIINYPGKVGDYLARWKNAPGKVGDAVRSSLSLFDDYLNALRKANNLPELYPSQAQREAYNRQFSQLMSAAMKKAEDESALLSFVSKAVLLYGRKSIDYIYEPDGKSNRMEIPLISHSTEMEFPRYGIVDPFGLDYMLMVFKVEQRKI